MYPIETLNALEGYKPNEWTKLDKIVHATIRIHLSESVYFTMQLCSTAFQIWKTLLDTYEKKVTTTKIHMIRRLYNLRMNESDSVHAHLNEYESLRSQILTQGMTIKDELNVMLLTILCNALTSAVKYSEVTSSILTKDT